VTPTGSTKIIELNKSTSSGTSESSDSQITIKKTLPGTKSSSETYYSTPDSSQTESDDISPQIQRKRHPHPRDKLPRFSISFDDDINIM
jgi:microtubule-associated serine/threonine kinase